MNIQSIAGGTSNAPPQRPLVDKEAVAQRAEASRAESAQTQKAIEPTQQSAQPASKEDVKQAVQSINAFVKAMNNPLQFSVDDETGQTVVKVIDSNTKEVIKQFPSEEALSIAKALDKVKGLLVQQKA